MPKKRKPDAGADDGKKSKEEQAAEARAAREAKKSKDRFVHVADVEEKMPPQMVGIIDIVKAAGKKGLSRTELVEAMKGVITTRQPEARILTYYQKRLVECGAVEIVNE